MPMVGDALGAAIKTNLQAIANITDEAELTAFCNALGEAIVTYIQTNAVVTTVDVIASATTLTPGSPGAGTGTGTIA